MCVLVLHPDFADPGGVAAYYRKLRGKFATPVEHLFIGKRPGERRGLASLRRMLADLTVFWRKLSGPTFRIVHINPSLDPKSLIRDGTWLILAKLRRKKVVVFFRGWQTNCARAIHRHWKWPFRIVFGCADAVIVLSREHGSTLQAWGIDAPLFHEFTIIDDEALVDFNLDAALRERLSSKTRRILFISRLTADKGVYEVIDAVHRLSRKLRNLELVIAGDGPALDGAMQVAAERQMTNVRFAGYVTGERKRRIFEKAHLLCFPTQHGEGMPNSIAESMGYGLPVVTRSVGGINDFFVNRVHGLTTRLNQPQVFADMIEALLDDHRIYRRIAGHNYRFAQSRFKASNAARRLDRIYHRIESNSKHSIRRYDHENRN
jgi:glycosyltransferase involved in cell wall biosynthesis